MGVGTKPDLFRFTLNGCERSFYQDRLGTNIGKLTPEHRPFIQVLDGLDLSSCFSHVEGCLYARSSRAQRAAAFADAAAGQGRLQEQLLLEAVPDIQIQQDHVRTNDDVRTHKKSRQLFRSFFC